MERHTSNANQDMVKMWEQMGSSTGSFLGRMIGLSAEFGLQAYQQFINNPLKQASKSMPGSFAKSENPQNIREKTWSNMGAEYGDAIGSSIGMTMDYMINSMKNYTSDMAPRPSNNIMKKVDIEYSSENKPDNSVEQKNDLS